MKDEDKIKERLIQELVELRQQVTELEASEMKHKQAQEALRESEEKYRLLAESLPDLVYEFDLEGKFIYVNEAATHLFGYSMDEILSDIRVEDTITEEDKVHLREAIHDIMKGKLLLEKEHLSVRMGQDLLGRSIPGPSIREKMLLGLEVFFETSATASGWRNRCTRARKGSENWLIYCRRQFMKLIWMVNSPLPIRGHFNYPVILKRIWREV